MCFRHFSTLHFRKDSSRAKTEGVVNATAVLTIAATKLGTQYKAECHLKLLRVHGPRLSVRPASVLCLLAHKHAIVQLGVRAEGLRVHGVHLRRSDAVKKQNTKNETDCGCAWAACLMMNLEIEKRNPRSPSSYNIFASSFLCSGGRGPAT